MAKKVLLTGFEGWGGDQVNPASKLVDIFKNKEVPGAEVIAEIIPVDTKKTSHRLVQLLNETKPDVLLSIGSWPGISEIFVERIGTNILDFPLEDNSGNTPIDERTYPEGPLAYYSTLPIKSIVQNLLDNGIPAKISNTASTYVCNQTLYTGLHYAETKNKDIKVGFIHVPILPEQVARLKNGGPSMSLETESKAIELAIKTIINTEEDIKVPGSL